MNRKVDRSTRGKLWIGISLVSMLLGVLRLSDVAMQRPSGLILGPIWDSYGYRGVAGYWMAVGAAGVIFGSIGLRE